MAAVALLNLPARHVGIDQQICIRHSHSRAMSIDKHTTGGVCKGGTESIKGLGIKKIVVAEVRTIAKQTVIGDVGARHSLYLLLIT